MFHTECLMDSDTKFLTILASYLVAAPSLAVDAGILTRNNLHVIGGDGERSGAIIPRKAAEIDAQTFKFSMFF